MHVILSGNGGFTSNNQRLYQERDNSLALMVALSIRDGGTGLIAAMSNSGGTESLEIDEETLRSVGAFFDWIDENGGDKRNAITWGMSRGGLTALIWAINLLGLDYSIHTVFAVSPATHLGSMSQISIATHPSLASLYRVTGEVSQRKSSQILELWTGTVDPEQADRLLSPVGLTDKLVGKQVMVATGTHDSFYPLAFSLEFDRKLSESGVTHALAVTLGAGHERSLFMFQNVAAYVKSLTSNESYEFLTGRFYFVDQNPVPDNLDHIPLQDYFATHGINADPHKLPVTVEIPYRAVAGDIIDIWICDTAGVAVELMATSAQSGERLYSYVGNLPEQECIANSTAVSVSPAEYTWTLKVNGEYVPATNTPTRDQAGCGLPATTTVTAENPDPESAFAFNNHLGHGFIQYSSQPAFCERTP